MYVLDLQKVNIHSSGLKSKVIFCTIPSLDQAGALLLSKEEEASRRDSACGFYLTSALSKQDLSLLPAYVALEEIIFFNPLVIPQCPGSDPPLKG